MADTRTPFQIVAAATEAGEKKAQVEPRQLFVRAVLAGLLIAISTSFAITVWTQPFGKELPLLGAVVFPVGFSCLVILGLELVTGNMCLIPMAVYAGRASLPNMLKSWFFVFMGNLFGSLVYSILFYIIYSNFGEDTSSPIAQKTMQLAISKTHFYEERGIAGWALAFLKGILCNWMVTMGVIMNFTSTSTLGRIVAMSLPVIMFVAQGFEHVVVNFIVIPSGMMFGADITLWQWFFWNLIPVLLGNVIGGCFLTGIPLAYAYPVNPVNLVDPVPAPPTEVCSKMELGLALVENKRDNAVAGA